MITDFSIIDSRSHSKVVEMSDQCFDFRIDYMKMNYHNFKVSAEVEKKYMQSPLGTTMKSENDISHLYQSL